MNRYDWNKFINIFELFYHMVSENGLLSYENPNYHLGPSNRLDDALNSNTENIYENIYQELDDICNMGHGIKAPIPIGGTGRRAYASLDIESMGVDVNTGPLTRSDSQNFVDNRRLVTLTYFFSYRGDRYLVGVLQYQEETRG